MNLYDNRGIRVRAFSQPYTPAEREIVKTLLYGFNARVSDELAEQLAEIGIIVTRIDNSSYSYISHAEA